MHGLIWYVADPFVDTGVAVLEHRIAKSWEDFSQEDLAEHAIQLKQIYAKVVWKNYLSIQFPNTCWCPTETNY